METPVKQLMTGTPVSIEPDASALAALELMIDHGIRHLPVVDAGRRVVGVLSIDDLRAAFPMEVSLTHAPSPKQREQVRDTSVAEVMSYAPETVRAETPLESAALRMAERRIGCLPVVDAEGRLEGILSETDVLHAVATSLWTDRLRAQRKPGTEALIVDTLRREHDRLLAKLRGYERHEQEITETRREAPLDLAEHGADVQDAQLTEALAEGAARRLRALETALERAEQGHLGCCQGCGGRIAPARLRALPEATLCIRCARQAG